MGYLETGVAANDATFQLRVQACLFKLAQDVLNEDPMAEHHEARAGLAQRTVENPPHAVSRFTWLCAANPAIAATVSVLDGEVTVAAPDGDIEFVCASNWTTVAYSMGGAYGPL